MAFPLSKCRFLRTNWALHGSVCVVPLSSEAHPIIPPMMRVAQAYLHTVGEMLRIEVRSILIECYPGGIPMLHPNQDTLTLVPRARHSPHLCHHQT